MSFSNNQQRISKNINQLKKIQRKYSFYFKIPRPWIFHSPILHSHDRILLNSSLNYSCCFVACFFNFFITVIKLAEAILPSWTYRPFKYILALILFLMINYLMLKTLLLQAVIIGTSPVSKWKTKLAI